MAPQLDRNARYRGTEYVPLLRRQSWTGHREGNGTLLHGSLLGAVISHGFARQSRSMMIIEQGYRVKGVLELGSAKVWVVQNTANGFLSVQF